MSARVLHFYFDFISPFGFFASRRIDSLAARHGVACEWHPSLLGVTVLKVMGLPPIPDTPLKGPYSRTDAARYARRHRIPIARKPGRPPPNPLPAGRAAAWLKHQQPDAFKPVCHALYEALWLHDAAIGDLSVVLSVAAAQGADRAVLQAAFDSGEAAAALRLSVERAVAAGAFGVPFFIIDGEPFWGVDKLELLEQWIAEGGW